MIALHHADMREWLAAYDGPLFDSAVTDPPYELGFMGKSWDKSGVTFAVDTWRAVFDRLKPGAHLAAFGGTRTYHRMVCAIEDAGFEIRDQLAWAYGTGFPKSLDVSKAIDAAAGVERTEVVGTKLGRPGMARDGSNQRSGTNAGFGGENVRVPSPDILAPATPEAAQWQGWGTALKPAWEPICLARKPLVGTVAANVQAHGTGALNIDGCRVETEEADDSRRARNNTASIGFGGSEVPFISGGSEGRWPANIIHDGSDEVLAAFPAEAGSNSATPGPKSGEVFGAWGERTTGYEGGRSSAARFFYCAKAGKLDRLGSTHPTVKPIALMRWLSRLITPPAGLVLDPFAGSGTTGISCMAEGFDCVLVELVSEHVADIQRKLDHLAAAGPGVFNEPAPGKPSASDGPLFGEAP